MGNDKLVLKDGTEVTLESSQGIGALYVHAENKEAACGLWGKFTKANLLQVAVKNADGITVGAYPNMVLDRMEGRENPDGTVTAMFSLRSKTTEEILLEKVAELEAGKQTQDEAISDLGQAVSDIVEGGVQ